MKNDDYANIIDTIKGEFGHAIVPRCSEKGCDLGLEKLGIYVALKGELLCGDTRKICDYIIFRTNGDFSIGIIELKGKNPKATEIIEKISNGKDIALNIIEDHIGKIGEPKFFLLALAKGWDGSQSRRVKPQKSI